MEIDPREVTLERRGFTAKSPAAKQRLEHIGECFLEGYHAALLDQWPDALAERLLLVEEEYRGFAYEGAAMALFLLDRMTPWSGSRFGRFLAGSGRSHAYMLHVGAGWVFGRLPISPMRAMDRMDPMLRWLAIDGYAFHEAYFRPQQAVYGGLVASGLTGYARHAWDMGLGRALWFVEGMDVNRISARINTFATHRHGELWSGVGLACAYAGGADESEIRQLVRMCGSHRPQFAQGVAFAAKARQCAGNTAAHTELACKIAWSLPAADAARITDEELAEARATDGCPAFESWQRGIQARFANSNIGQPRTAELIGV
jgi:hypothetical protein